VSHADSYGCHPACDLPFLRKSEAVLILAQRPTTQVGWP
jgi:hypothetical protein